MKINKSYLTAISRKKLSLPVQYLLSNNFLVGKICDFGCGKGFDADDLARNHNLDVFGYDPYWRPCSGITSGTKDGKFDTVYSVYVLNVLEPKDQVKVVKEIDALLKVGGTAYVAVRSDLNNLNGWTKRDTYQCISHVYNVVPSHISLKCLTHKSQSYTIYYWQKM